MWIALVCSHVYFTLAFSVTECITENYSVFVNSMFIYLSLLPTKLKVIIICLFENKDTVYYLLKLYFNTLVIDLEI